MVAERWKPLPNAPGYEVSDAGNVRSFRKPGRGVGMRKTPRFIHPYQTGSGYLAFRVGRKKAVYVHHAVLATFHGARPFQGAEGRHLNGCKTDNRAVNLQWGDDFQNARDKFRTGTQPFGDAVLTSKLRSGDVIDIVRRLHGGERREAIAAEKKVTVDTIGKIWRGETWAWLTGRGQ